MTEHALTFTDDQLIAALKVAAPELQQAVAIIAMQLELSVRRANDETEEEEDA